MIKYFIFAFLPLLLLSCNPCLDGSGNIVKEERSISYFESVLLDASADVEISKGTEFAISVEIDDNILPVLITEVNGKQLVIDFKENVCFTKAKIYVTVPIVKNITNEGSGDIFCDNITEVEHFFLKNDGSGGIKIEYIDCPQIKTINDGSGDIKINRISTKEITLELEGSGDIFVDNLETEFIDAKNDGSGNITGKGETIEAKFYVDGSGDVEFMNFKSHKTEATNDGSGDISTYTIDKLRAEIYGSGNIYYKGEPSLDRVKIDGSGELIKK